jgi:hypothetical protein
MLPKMERWSAFYDDELTDEEKELLGENPDVAEEMKLIAELSGALQVDEKDPDLAALLDQKDRMKERILDKFELRQEQKEFSQKHFTLPWPMAAAAAFVLIASSLFGGYFFGQTSAEQAFAQRNALPNVSITENELNPEVEIDIPETFSFSVYGEDQLVHLSHLEEDFAP